MPTTKAKKLTFLLIFISIFLTFFKLATFKHEVQHRLGQGTFKNEVRLSVKNLIKNKSKINGGSIDKKLQTYQRKESSKDLCFDLRRTKRRKDIPGDWSS
jgi:hypothetical protein